MTARCNDGSYCLNWLNPEVMDPVVKVVSNESRVSFVGRDQVVDESAVDKISYYK
jgi:hypothetical protein